MDRTTTVSDIIKLAPEELKSVALACPNVVVKVQTPIGELTFSKELFAMKMVDY